MYSTYQQMAKRRNRSRSANKRSKRRSRKRSRKRRSSKRKGGKRSNPWLAHVKKVMAANKGMAFKNVLKKAKTSYKK